MIKSYSKSEMVTLLKENNQTQPKAKYSNNVLLSMLEKMPNDFNAVIEDTRNGFSLNRGSVCESIVKAFITETTSVKKSTCFESDLDTSKVKASRLDKYGLPKSTNIEIKFSTSFAPATAKTSKARTCLLVGESGIYLINAKDLIATAKGKININNQRANVCKRLNELSKALGL